MDDAAVSVTDRSRTTGGFVAHLHSIRTHLITLLTLVVTVVYGVVGYFEIHDELEEVSARLHQEIKLLSDVQAGALSDPLWNFDQDEVERQLNVLIANRNIEQAWVIGSDGAIFAQASSVHPDADATMSPKSHTHHGVSKDAHSGDDVISGSVDHRVHVIERDIRAETSVKIGLLKIAMTHDQVADLQQDLLLSQLKQFLIITLVIALTIGIAVTGLVRPVLNITHAMDKVAAGDLSIAIPATDRRDEIGKMARALEVFKANAEQLKIALDKERELNGLQRQFVSMVSHEFRTPLAIIDGNAQRMMRRLQRMDPDRLQKGLLNVRRSVTRLTELMESVLNAAHLEEGRIAFQPERCQLIDLINELCMSYSDINPDRTINLDTDALPEEVFADPKLLRQVISNFLSNATKYSEKGTSIWLAGHFESPDEWAISIRDEGVGIPANELDQLFQRFFRASTSTGIAGSGIGLHLVQHFVGLHQGRIEVESSANEGTTFTAYFPIKASCDSAVPAAA
ncbi:MAG: ATP-binding protein [Geminicoccaceae bacterium]